MAYTGEALNINNINNGWIDSSAFSPRNRDVRKANNLIEKTQADNAALKVLAKNLFNSTIKSQYENTDATELAITVVEQWADIENYHDLSNWIREGAKKMDKWQKDFVNFIKNPTVKKIYMFTRNKDWHVWIAADEPSTNDILNFTKKYISFLDKENNNIEFEFMVYGLNEIFKDSLPDDCIDIEV